LSDGAVDPGYLAETRSVLHSLGRAVADRRTAAVFWGMDMLVEPRDVEVRVPRTQTRVKLAGVRARCSSQTAKVPRAVLGLAAVDVTPALDTVLDCCVDRPMLEAVVIADSALRRKLITLEELRAGVADRSGTSGARKLRRLLTLVDERSGSVLESMLRYLLNTNGLWPPSQRIIRNRDGKRVVGRVDFCFPDSWLVIECDGRRWHDPADARNSDRERDNGLARSGWRVLRFTWAEVRHSPSLVLACVRDALLPVAA
jgi:very-short-patch-repair endonuclease